VIYTIKISSKGDFGKIERFFKNTINSNFINALDKYAKEGVSALASATPIDSGETKNSWTYKVEKYSGGAKIIWLNTNVINGVPIAIILQYGHGTGNGGYVEGRDYINPALRPVFDKIANEAWREVTKL
jgi:hypothetical protein